MPLECCLAGSKDMRTSNHVAHDNILVVQEKQSHAQKRPASERGSIIMVCSAACQGSRPAYDPEADDVAAIERGGCAPVGRGTGIGIRLPGTSPYDVVAAGLRP